MKTLFSTILLLSSAIGIATSACAETQPFAASPIPTEQLQRIVGQAELDQHVISNNTGTVANNRIDGDSVTGTINFDGQAFASMSGLAVVSANTGNNVAINAALNVNVSLRP